MHTDATPHRQSGLSWPGGASSALAAVAFLLLRLAILLSAPDRLGHLGEGELGHANLALDISSWIRGGGWHFRYLWAYQVVPFHGGTWLTSLLFVPFSALFGTSWLSLKGMALAYACVTLVAWMWSLNRLVGPGAAAAFAWFMAFAPPVLVRMQLTLWGTHAEVSSLQALGIALLVSRVPPALAAASIPPASSCESGDRFPLWCGLLAGLSVAFNYSAVVSSLLLVMALGIAGGIRSLRGGLLVLGGAAGGLLPLLYLILAGRGSLKIYEQGLSSSATPGLLEGAGDRLLGLPRLLLQLPPFSPQMPPEGPESLTGLAVALHLLLYGAAVWVLSRAWRLWRHLGQKPSDSVPWEERLGACLLGVVGLYPFLFAGVFAAVHLPFTSSSASTFGFCPRYAATLYPFLGAALGIALSDFGAPPSERRAHGPARWDRMPRMLGGGLVLSLFLLPGVWDDMKLIEPATPTLGLSYNPLPLTKADLWAVDRRSIRGIERFVALERAGRVSSPLAQGFRSLLTEPWSSEYWRLLESPPDGPSRERVQERLERLLLELPPDPASAGAYEAGLRWAAAVALGALEPPAQAAALLKELRR